MGGTITAGGTLLVVIEYKIYREKHKDIFAEDFLLIAPFVISGGWMFQQDNNSIHVSQSIENLLIKVIKGGGKKRWIYRILTKTS